MLKTLTFTISAENHPGLQARTVMLFHRIPIPISRLIMQRLSDRSNMRMVIPVLVDPAKSERIAASLGKIVHLRCVETRTQMAKPARTVSATVVDTP